MTAIILAAIWGVVMMYSGIVIKNKATAKTIALLGILALLVVNHLEYNNIWYISLDVKDMLKFTPFSYVFNYIALGSTLIYFLLNSDELETVGKDVYEYYALIFFILCGVSLASSFNTLLMLFLGIEIISIPLYILAGSDKRNLKSNEASLKYFLMGSFSTGIMLMGIAFYMEPPVLFT